MSWLVNLAPAIGVGLGEAERWVAVLEIAAAEGRFFFTLPWAAAICSKANRQTSLAMTSRPVAHHGPFPTRIKKTAHSTVEAPRLSF